MRKTSSGGVQCRRVFRTIKLGCVLQRLYSTFPDRWPGFGLLLLRLGIAIALIDFGTTSLFVDIPAPISVTQNLIADATGIFLLVGFWTPIMAGLAAVDQMWIALSVQFSRSDVKWICIFLALLSASLAMLGPGAWSIDARLFGRRRFPSHGNRSNRIIS